MKINGYISALFILVPCLSFGQFDKGRWAAGSTVSYINNQANSNSIVNNSSTSNSSSNFTFSLQGEKFIMKNLSLGLGYQMYYTGNSSSFQAFNDSGRQISGQQQHQHFINQGIGGLAGIYFPFSQKAGISLNFSAYYTFISKRLSDNGFNELTNFYINANNTKRGQEIILDLTPRVYAFITPRLNLNFSLGGLHYDNTRYMHPDEDNRNTQYFAFNFNLFNYKLGVQYLF